MIRPFSFLGVLLMNFSTTKEAIAHATVSMCKAIADGNFNKDIYYQLNEQQVDINCYNENGMCTSYDKASNIFFMIRELPNEQLCKFYAEIDMYKNYINFQFLDIDLFRLDITSDMLNLTEEMFFQMSLVYDFKYFEYETLRKIFQVAGTLHE